MGRSYKKVKPWDRQEPGRKKIFETPKDLWDAAVEYFAWAEANPLEKPIIHQGKVQRGKEKLPRPFTVIALSIHLGFCSDSYYYYRRREAFKDVTNAIDEIIYNQKFEGASVGLFNAGLISRDLGLAEKTEVKETTNDLENLAKLTTFLEENGIDINAIK